MSLFYLIDFALFLTFLLKDNFRLPLHTYTHHMPARHKRIVSGALAHFYFAAHKNIYVSFYIYWLFALTNSISIVWTGEFISVYYWHTYLSTAACLYSSIWIVIDKIHILMASSGIKSTEIWMEAASKHIYKHRFAVYTLYYAHYIIAAIASPCLTHRIRHEFNVNYIRTRPAGSDDLPVCNMQ